MRIESVMNAFVAYLSTRVGSMLAVSATPSLKVTLAPPTPEHYFIGEPSRYRKYIAPVVFVMLQRSRIPEGTGGASEWQNVRYIEHTVLVDWILEGITEVDLTRGCWRVAEAIDATLHDQEVMPASTEDVTVKTFVVGVDYGPITTLENRAFRKDVVVECLLKQWELMTPLATP